MATKSKSVRLYHTLEREESFAKHRKCQECGAPFTEEEVKAGCFRCMPCAVKAARGRKVTPVLPEVEEDEELLPITYSTIGSKHDLVVEFLPA